jgi:hypothetical protein
MLDRIELLRDLNGLPLKLTGTAQRALEKTLDKAIGQMLVALPLAAARRASPQAHRMISAGLIEALTMAELKKLSKVWEPKRAVPQGAGHAELAADLIALMNGDREPFEPTKLGLAQARSLGGAEKAALAQGIERYASAPQLKPILKKWDKASPLNTGGDEKAVRAALLALLRAP